MGLVRFGLLKLLVICLIMMVDLLKWAIEKAAWELDNDALGLIRHKDKAIDRFDNIAELAYVLDARSQSQRNALKTADGTPRMVSIRVMSCGERHCVLFDENSGECGCGFVEHPTTGVMTADQVRSAESAASDDGMHSNT